MTNQTSNQAGTALSDLPADLPGLVRIETHDREAIMPMIVDGMRSVYPHEQIFGKYCTVNDYVNCPPDEVFLYLSHTLSLEEWTYSLRGFDRTDEPGLWLATDRLGGATYLRTVAHADARTVDYHCAWDQGKHLWMVYLMRVLDARTVLDVDGSVVLWTNCHHPFYDENPYPETAPEGRTEWVGDLWDTFAPGHQLEMSNLKAICEYRWANNLPVTPTWMSE